MKTFSLCQLFEKQDADAKVENDDCNVVTQIVIPCSYHSEILTLTLIL